MGWIKKVFSAIAGYFKSGKAQNDIELVAEFVPKALPFIKMAAEIGTMLTPTQADDVALAGIKAAYPMFFSGKELTPAEFKLALLGVATDLMRAKYPGLTTSVARAAVQVAYVGQSADQKQLE